MVDPRKVRDGGGVEPSDSSEQKGAGREHRGRTEGTDRDFDSTGESANQGHGHPREERESAKER
jgi:hypothetical protein